MKTTPVRVIRALPDGDGGYRLRFDEKGKAVVYRATGYGVKRVIASHGAIYDGKSGGGWHTWRVPNPTLRDRPPRYCEDCGATLPDKSPIVRRYCSNACKLRGWRREIGARKRQDRL